MNQELNLRVGEWVEVRSADEILGSLDDRLTLEGLLFMPEMLQYCGQRFRVYKSAHKTCDTLGDYVIRRMNNTVHLEGLRCDGASHGQCQAECLLFWKDAWLKRVEGNRANSDERSAADRKSDGGVSRGLSALDEATRAPSSNGEIRYRCQATDLRDATIPVRRRDRWRPGFYLKDLTSGNVKVRDFVRYGLIAAINSCMLLWRGKRYPRLEGLAGAKTPAVNLNLQPGEQVRVKSRREIMRTLGSNLRNRGLYFDVEMAVYCEKGSFTVHRKVERIIDEKSGRMINLPNACWILGGVTCTGCHSSFRMFCPRSIYPYWHEVWLKRVD